MTETEWHGSRAERLEQLVNRSKNGDLAARQQMEAFIYKELHRLATTYLQREHPHPVAMGGLVEKAITRIVGASGYTDQHQFYAAAARIMRNVLVDYAKARRATKQRGSQLTRPLTDAIVDAGEGIDVVEVDELLGCLMTQSPRAAHAFELHYFAGLTLNETARLLDTSLSDVKRQIRFAKAWLMAELESSPRAST